MQKNQVDHGLNFKKRARRRLVGAVALVFLMIIILPMILEDREEGLLQEEVEITMPNQEAADLVAHDDLDANADENVKAEVVELPEVKVPPVNPGPKEVVKPKAKPEPKKPIKPVEVKKAPVENPSKAVVKQSDKFYVQIGVFSDITNVKKLQDRLNDLGYKSITEKMTTDKGIKTRLRTETFVGRNEAAIALENIKDSGLTGMVVNQK